MTRGKTIELLYAIAAIAVLLYLLFNKLFIGIADNGDFLRIMGSIGLNDINPEASYEERYFKYAYAYYAYDAFFRGFYPSTQLILVAAARGIAYLFNSSFFDIRYLAAIYSILLIIACMIIIHVTKHKSWATALALAVLFIFVFHDVGYTAYFNSLYGEPVSFIFLLLTFAIGYLLLQANKPRVWLFVLFVICCLFFICSKTQNAPMGICFAFFCFRLISLDSQNRAWRQLTIWSSIIIVLLSMMMYIFAPKDFKQMNIYQTVFYGILHQSPDVEGDLQTLGLPSELAVLAGTNYFQNDVEINQDAPFLQQYFYSHISHADVGLFYVKHPQRLLQLMDKAAEYSMTIRPYYLGNYEKSAGFPPGAVTKRFSGWSEIKKNVLPNNLSFIGLVFLAYYSVVFFEWKRSSIRRIRIQLEGLMLLGLIGLFSYLVPLIGDGLADVSKHLFTFNVVFDMMLLLLLVWSFYKLFHMRKRLI